MSTEERDLEENKGGQQEEEFKPKDDKEEKAIDNSEMGDKGKGKHCTENSAKAILACAL